MESEACFSKITLGSLSSSDKILSRIRSFSRSVTIFLLASSLALQAADAPKAISIVKKANERGQLMSLNFDLYQGGQVTPETLAIFRELKAAIYARPE